MSTTRLTAEQRKVFREIARAFDKRLYRCSASPTEPALGTLAERLDIIYRRHGGRSHLSPLTPAERAQITIEYVEES